MISTGNVFLTVRGVTSAETLEHARTLHNQTAGNPQGVAAAQTLGDFSHNVFIPLDGAKSNELLFHDVWQSPEGLMKFFSNPDVQKSGGALFKNRDATVWMPATGALSYGFPAPARRTERYVGMVRGPIASPEKAIEIFNKVHAEAMGQARRHSQMSHQLYIKLNPPGDNSPLELLGVDVWYDKNGMTEMYKALDMKTLGAAFSGPADPTIWQSAPGEWVEW